ncbi:unnamed protein product [Cylindrotheca closterium]|uniref:Uncharacterized protein n=1 Tax=Cylindrotheca closterium TaxID=2856 RepID=A0AAD2FPM1_9STRA|nr:unnamed protein product [Cylindrotheca closterium]
MATKKFTEYSNIPHSQDETQLLQPATEPEQNEDDKGNDECPPELQLFRWENVLIPACYLCVGLTQGLNRPLLNVYPLDLGANESQQATIGLVLMIPATMKIIFGFLSDNFPILGYRRKSYMLIGWLSVTFIMILLHQNSDLRMAYNEYGDAVPPKDAPSVELVSITFLVSSIGMWMADVMGDSIVAEKARLEPKSRKGQLQSTCYASRFFGMMVAAPLSTVMYSHYGPGSVVLLIACTPLPIVPILFAFSESKARPSQPIKEHLTEIWHAVCFRAVWQPLGFLYFFNLLQVQNSAWRQYLSTVLDFTAQELNWLLVASYIFTFVGTMAYKEYFLKTSWRRVYQFCILTNGLLTCTQLLLIKGKTFGLSNFWFSLGDDAAQEFISGVQFLPASIMIVNLCPPGSEGASYALYTTMWNVGMILAPSISSVLLSIWDVSVEALEAGNLDGLFKLSLLTAVIKTSPIFLLFLLPQTRDQLFDMTAKPSVLGGTIFLLVLFGSMFYIIVVGILNIVDPGWAGAS